jgi:hypothetical protein
VVAIVIDDENAVDLAANLKTPLRPSELAEPGGNAFKRQTELKANGDRCESILKVVTSGNAQAEWAQRNDPPRGIA